MQNTMPAWTVSQIIQNAGRLGIPHFQRGLVWGSDAVGALLESLYYDTPCGSFVLWEPKQPEHYGVALDPSRGTPFDKLVIDGQQRIRSLYDVYGDAAKRDPGRIWCINLTQLGELRKLLVPQQREYPLFVSVVDPATLKDKDAGGALRRNLLPLHLVQSNASWDAPALAPYRELLSALTQQKDALQQQMPTIYQKIHRNVLRMQDRLFSISLQKSDDVGEMASLYNRINSGGKRVDVEERAFAKLVGLQPGTYTHLDDLFRAIHPADSEFALQRDQLLTRQKERAFGFKLFIRVFLQVCQHHLGFLYGKVDITFDLANRASFAAAFGALSEPDVAELWRHTRRVVTTVRDVLRDQLYCDDLRFLPEANCLAPVFQLLIHYPELSHDEYRSLLARLCLHLCLAEPDSKSMTTLVNLAANNRKLADAVLREMFETLEKRNSLKELAKRLEGANSIQSRYVLMLYWLQRSLGAEDFRYEQVADSKTLIKPEAVLSQKVKAEKQHLLPFQKAQLIYGTDLGRGESHIVNGIGNLTYISRPLNDFIGGLGERFALLDLEPPKNKRAHLLCDEAASDGVLRDYGELVAALKDSAEPKVGARLKSVFERMVNRRRALVCEAFGAWLDRLAKDSADRFQALCMHDGTHARLEPGAPMYVSTDRMADAYQVRKLGLPHADEDRLIELIGRARRLKPYKNDPALRFQLTRKRKLIWVKALPGEQVCLRFDSSLTDDDRAKAIGLLGLDSMVGPVPKSIELTSVPRFEALLAEIEKGWPGQA